MLTTDVLRARAFRLALAFCVAISVATAIAFAAIYLSSLECGRATGGAVLVDEAIKSEDDSDATLQQALDCA